MPSPRCCLRFVGDRCVVVVETGRGSELWWRMVMTLDVGDDDSGDGGSDGVADDDFPPG